MSGPKYAYQLKLERVLIPTTPGVPNLDRRAHPAAAVNFSFTHETILTASRNRIETVDA
jgi:hypothetical protein